MPREPFRLDVKMERLADSIWVFRDHLVFARGGEIRRTQFMERVGDGRYRATADDMPRGADEEGSFLEDGTIDGVILVSWHGIPLARTPLRLRRA